MHNYRMYYSEDIYAHFLQTINGIRFSRREMDVIACLLKGRTTKKIAAILLISPKTVATHVRNIMLKLEVNSRDSILDFFEKSNKYGILKKYYESLLANIALTQSLIDLSNTNRQEFPSCFLIYGKDQHETNIFAEQTQAYLKLAGIHVSIEALEQRSLVQTLYDLEGKDHFIICILPESLDFNLAEQGIFEKVKPSSKSVLFVLPERENNKNFPEALNGFSIIDLNEKKNPYLFIFEILKKLLPTVDLEKNVGDFIRQYEPIQDTDCSSNFIKDLSVCTEGVEGKGFLQRAPIFLHSKVRLFLAIFLVISLGGIVFFSFIKSKTNAEKYGLNQVQKHEGPTLQSDLSVPADSALLHRSTLLNQIDKKLQKSNGIRTVVISGIGGAGKTTLARQYARAQKANIIWEVNAETNESISLSFKNLADALARSEGDNKILKELHLIVDPSEREKKVLQFVKDKLKSQPNWILIFDNVREFAHIQKYFPHNANTWGTGKVILTSRNSHIQNNKHVEYDIEIGSLNPEEKLDLFLKIMGLEEAHSLSSTQREEAKEFLNEIPPFPLDVSLAGHYLKVTHSPYKTYLYNLNKSDKSFLDLQEKLLKGAGAYEKVRYNIVTLSLDHLINSSKDFKELLLLVSILDSQNIPIYLLRKFKNDSIVDEFLYNLKQQSFITNRSSSFRESTFSIHRSTQTIILDYVTRKTNINENREVILSILNSVDNYVEDVSEREDFINLKNLETHLRALLNHPFLSEEGLLLSNLGQVYYWLCDYEKAKPLCEKGLFLLKKKHPEWEEKRAQVLLKLGNIYTQIGQYENAKTYIKKSLSLFKNNPCNHKGIGESFGYLGVVYKELGDYEKARKILEYNYDFLIKNFSQDHFIVGWNLAYLGSIYLEIGDYQKAKDYLEKSLVIYESQFSRDHYELAWIIRYLGDAYHALGDHNKAQELHDRSLSVSSHHFPKDHFSTTWVLLGKGIFEKDIGNYEKAETLFKAILMSYEKIYCKNNVEIAHVLLNLGQNYLLKKESINAEIFLKRALTIFQQNKHSHAYKCFESLAELYPQQSATYAREGNISKSQEFKKKAIDSLKQALEITKMHFPKDSPHILRIQAKLDSLSGT